MLSIGQVAKQTDIGVETVRYYEREGLLSEPQRLASGYRQYDEHVLKRILFIKQAKGLGFTLKEIKQLLSLRSDTKADCAEMKAIANKKIVEIEEKISALTSMKEALRELSDVCPGKGNIGACPILDALEMDSEE